MNSSGGDRRSPPLPGGEFLLRLLHKDPTVLHRPIQSNGHDLSHINGNPPQNPYPKVQSLSDGFQNLGLYHGFRDDVSETREGNPQFNRFADNFYGSPNTSRNPRGDFREGNGLFNGFEANCRGSSSSSSRGNNSEANYRNSISGGSNRAVNGCQDNYFNYLNSNNGGSNKALNGFEGIYRNSQNLSRIGEGYDRPNMTLNVLEANYRNSPNSSGFGDQNSQNLSRIGEGYDRPNMALNGLEANYRNSTNSSGFGDRNSQNSSRIGEGYDRPNMALNGLEANYRNSPNSSGFGEGYDRPNMALNGLEANYRNSPNSSGFGEGYDRPNKALNGLEVNYRNSPDSSGFGEGYDRPNRALNGIGDDNRNSPNLSRIREGYDRPNRALNGLEAQNTHGFDSDFPKFPNYRNISRTGVARHEVKQTPPGFANKATIMNCGYNVESSSNGSRNWGIKYEDEREIGDKMIERNQGFPQLGSPVPPTESALKSVSGFEMEESLSELHKEIAENGEKLKKIDGGGRIQGDLDDLDTHGLGSLEEEDGSSDKNQKKKRDKDYRSDTRGQRVLAQWMRKSKRMIQCRRDIDIFNAPLLAIYNSLVPPEEEKMKQKQLLALLEKLVVKEWPEARLLVYGSCANSFGVKKSDIDICLAMKDADLNKCDILLKLADILKAENLENVQALTHARVPIVKLMDPVTGISCDICINNVLAVVNSKLLRDYAKIDDRLRQLAFIVKHWAKSRGVNETYHGTLSSYAYVLMCIHFLQQCRPAILPCLQGMEITYNVIVENVECAFFDRVEKLAGFGLRNRENIGQLVWGFFRYWAYCHDYTHDVVSVRVGSIISKQAKDWTRRVGNDRHLICIEDPFEITHDLGRVVDKFSIKVLKEEFERAAQIMQFDPNPCVTLFEPYVRSC